MRVDFAAWREWLGLSQRELAEQVGISAVALAEIERGHSRPRPSTIAAIARVLGVPRTTLLHSSPESEWEHGWRPPEPDSVAM